MSSDSFRCGGHSLAPRRVVLAVALAVALGSGAAGCASGPVSLVADAEPAGTSYNTSLERWTRTGRNGSVADLDTPIVIAATLRSRSFQRAYAERYLQSYKVNTPSERDVVLERERAVTDSGLSFWVRTTFHTYQWNDLRTPAGKWRVVLLDEAGAETPAESIDLLAIRDINQPVLLSGEPLDPYTKMWLVRFPALRADGQPLLAAGARKIILRVAGPVGHIDLTWLLN